jgi:hypothetical protein
MRRMPVNVVVISKMFSLNHFKLKNIMKKITVLYLLLSVSLFACKSKAKKEADDTDKYEKAKESLEEKEKKTSTAFLKVSGNDKHNLIGQTVIKGTVSNNAKICVYKDVELELSFFSKTGVLLEKDHETMYEVIEPGKSAVFKSKYFAPRGTDSVGLKVVGAKVK